MRIPILEADYYFISPLIIKDWEIFQKDLLSNTKKWVNKSDPNKNTIRNFISCFLGEDDAVEFPMQRGFAYRGSFAASGCKALSSINGIIKFRSSKGKVLQQGDEALFIIESNEMVLHISPNKKCAVAYIRLRCVSPLNLENAVLYNYHIHKRDKNQAPMVYMEGDDGEWVCTKGRETLQEIIAEMLPENAYVFSNDARFISSVFLKLDTSGNPDEKIIARELARLSLAKDNQYQITQEDVSNVNKLFDNIWTCASMEGLATVVLSPDFQKEKPFMKSFRNGAFLKSYLPLYLTAILADGCLKSALMHLDKIADDVDEQDRLREMHTVYNFEPSNFVHLNTLMQSIRKDRHFDLKFRTVFESVEARRIRNETVRLKQEKEVREAEEVRSKKQADLQARRDRNMNYLLGFIAIGQVIFAILELAGAHAIFGDVWAGSRCLVIISVILTVIFIGLIISIFIYLIRIHRNKVEV